MTGEASVAEGRETPISCPSCGERWYAVIVLGNDEQVQLEPCKHVVTIDALCRTRARATA